MKTQIISQTKNHTNTVLELSADGISNLSSLAVVTSDEDLSSFNGDVFMEDPGWMDGSSYISCRYSYGNTLDIQKLKNDIVSFGEKNEISVIDCLELFVFIFKSDDERSLLVSNIDEHLMFNDVEFEDIICSNFDSTIAHMVGGSITDDNDIGTNISQCLMSHPKTKGFKVPSDETYEWLADNEIPSWDEYIEYYGSVFVDSVTELKKGELYFDMFREAYRLVILNKEIFYGDNTRNENDMNTIIFSNLDFIQNMPNYVYMEYKHNNSNKFYDIELQNNAVLIQYGAIDKSSTGADKEFDTIEEAEKFYRKKVLSQVKSGYVPVSFS